MTYEWCIIHVSVFGFGRGMRIKGRCRQQPSTSIAWYWKVLRYRVQIIMSQTSLKQKVGLHIDIIMLWDYSTIYWNFSVAFFVHTAHGCLIQMCHQNYSKLSGTFFAGEILILYRANSRFRVPPGSNLNLSLMTMVTGGGSQISWLIPTIYCSNCKSRT